MKLPDFELSWKKAAVLLVFVVAGLLLYQVKFSDIMGVASQNFTLFQLMGPTAAAILGPAVGVVSVIFVEVLNFLVGGKPLDLITLVRFFPMALAAIYFGSKSKVTGLVAAACMLLFWMHPIGQQAWFYPLYWLIPVVAAFFKDNILARSLGATFTAHAVGSVAFLYAYNLPAEVWAALIPVVAVERLTFAAGIVVSFYALNSVLALAAAKWDFGSIFKVEKKYALLSAKED